MATCPILSIHMTREIIIKPATGKTVVHPFDQYIALDGSLITIWDYEVDKSGNILTDALGNKKIKMVTIPGDDKTPEKIGPKSFTIAATNTKGQRLRLPEQAHILQQLKECPHWEDCPDEIDGLSTRAKAKRFVILDPEESAFKDAQLQQQREAAWDHAKLLNDKQVRVAAALLNITRPEASISALRMDLTNFASNYAPRYTEKIMDNPNLVQDAIFMLATQKKIIRGGAGKPYQYYAKGEKTGINLGTTPMMCFEYLRQNPDISAEIEAAIDITGMFDQFGKFSFGGKAVTLSAAEAKMQEMQRLLEEKELEIMRLKDGRIKAAKQTEIPK